MKDQYILSIITKIRACTDVALLDLIDKILDESVQQST